MKNFTCLIIALLCCQIIYSNEPDPPTEKRQYFTQNLNGKEITLDLERTPDRPEKRTAGDHKPEQDEPVGDEFQADRVFFGCVGHDLVLTLVSCCGPATCGSEQVLTGC